MYSDETLIECIKASGYYECENDGVNVNDLPFGKRVGVILAGELLALRPELEKNDGDIVYIKRTVEENGSFNYSLPTKSISNLLKDPAYSESSIWSYSMKDGKLLKRLYQGTGTSWERK